MFGFTPRASAFGVAQQNTGATIVIVPMSAVAPPERNSDVRSFDEKRMILILRALRSGIPLPPVELDEQAAPPFRYKVYDGYHRYYASAAAGFSDLHVIVRPFCDLDRFFVAELPPG